MRNQLAVTCALASVLALPSAAWAIDAYGQFYNVSLPSNIGLRTDLMNAWGSHTACASGHSLYRLTAYNSSGAEMARFDVGNGGAGVYIQLAGGGYNYTGFGQVQQSYTGVWPTLEMNIDSNGKIVCIFWKGYSNGIRQGTQTLRYTSISNRIAQGNVTTLSLPIAATSRVGDTTHPGFEAVQYLSTSSTWTDWPSASTYPNSQSVYYSNDGCGKSGYIWGQTSGTVGGGGSADVYTETTFF